jgi:hypothetical protein
MNNELKGYGTKQSWTNFKYHLGFAWSDRKQQKTSVRTAGLQAKI